MIYLSKLAKRLALAGPRSGLLLSLLVFVGSCASPEEREFLSPNPTQPTLITSLTVEPRIGTARPGEVIQFSATARNVKGGVVAAEVDWSASGGSISGAGTFVSEAYGQFQVRATLRSNATISDSALVGVFLNPNDVLKLSVSPNREEVGEGEGIQLEATAELADGRVVVQPALAWSTDVGQVDGTGYFIAPEAEGMYEVKAVAPSGVSATASVVVTAGKKVLQTVTVSPGLVSLVPGQAQQFTAIGVWESGPGKIIPTVWSSTGGSITANGLFTAGSTPGNFKIIGRYQWGTQADTAFISITEPQIVGLDVAPGSVSLATGATQQFVANARMADGTTKPVGANWEATGGTISASGLFSATGNGAWKVQAKIAGTTLSGEADVTVSSPQATLLSLVLNPSTVSLAAGTHRQFSVTGTWSDGASRTPQVTWTATGGSITTGGDFTAGSATGTFSVIALSDGKADTSVVTVTYAVLNSVSISPDGVSLIPGATQQFVAAGDWSDGGSSAPAVGWSAEGGTISGSGLYTAGAVAGTYRIFATHASGQADTALVTVAPQAPVLVSIALAPASVDLAPGSTRQFSVSAAWTNGGSGTPPVTYTATGGTITAGGLYAAGAVAGTYRVIARQTDGTLADTSAVTISASAPTLVSLAISPKTTSLQTAGSRQFTVSAAWSDGSTAAPGITWTATSGTVSAVGLYVAPASAGTYKVVARETGGTKADTATVTVTAPAAVVALTVSPGTKSMATGGNQQFTAQATYSNGGSGTPSLAWTATGGTVSSTGLYTAASTAGNYRVVAQATGTTVKDTADVTLTTGVPPAVTALTLTPGSATLNAGATAQFSVVPTWSDGVSRAVTPTYAATGGTITSAGLFTAGQAAGTFLVIASCSGCTVADTSQVTIQGSGGPANGVTVTISPRTITLDVGEVYQFTATAKLASGATETNPSITWSAVGGGYVTTSGLYRAPGTAGTYALRVTHSSGATDDATITVVVPSSPYFSDSFDSCTLVKAANSQGFQWRDSGGGVTAEKPVIAKDFGRAGCSLKFTFIAGAAGDDSWSEQRFSFGKKLSEVYLKWNQYFPTGNENPSRGPRYAHRDDTGPDNNKFLRLWDDSYSAFRVKLGFSTLPTSGGNSQMIPEYGTNEAGVGQQGAQSYGSAITDATRGRWIEVRVHVRLATPSNNDGVIEMWMDGAKVITNTTLRMYPNAGLGNYLKNGYLMGWANSGFNATSQTFIDDVVISAIPIP